MADLTCDVEQFRQLAIKMNLTVAGYTDAMLAETLAVVAHIDCCARRQAGRCVETAAKTSSVTRLDDWVAARREPESPRVDG